MKSKINFLLIVLFLLVLLIPISCQKQKAEWKGTIEEIDGVMTVKNPGEPVYGEFTFSLEEDLSLGGDPHKDNYYFPRRASLAVDDDRNIYVLDSGNFRIQKYDSSGHYLLSIGRQGQGPGEFQYPSNLSLDAQGNILIFDSMTRAIKVFAQDGTYKESLNIRAFIQPQAFISEEGFIFGWRDDYRSPDGPKMCILKLTPENPDVETVMEFRGELKPNQTSFVIHAYSNRLAMCVVNPSAFCYGFSSEYKIYVADGRGETIRIIEKFEEPVPISKAEKEATVKDGKGIYATIGPEKGEGVVFPPHRPYFARIFADDRGRIYVLKRPSILNQEETKEFDVFGANGSYIYRIKLPFFPALIKAGFLYEVRTDEETGEITIVRNKITNWEKFNT
jgi:hypothetical protein